MSQTTASLHDDLTQDKVCEIYPTPLWSRKLDNPSGADGEKFKDINFFQQRTPRQGSGTPKAIPRIKICSDFSD